MNKNVMRATVCMLAGAITIGTVSYGVVANNTTAGVSSYTANILTSNTMPTAGVSLALSNTMIASEEQVQLAKLQVQNNETATVAEGLTEEATETQAAADEVAAVKSEYADYAVCQVDSLNVRSAASEEADIVGKLYQNNVAIVSGEENGWYAITSGSLVGYVKAEYVIVGSDDAVRAASKRVAYVTCDTLRVRREATTESDIISMVPNGDQLTVVDESVEGWVGVSVEAGTGYVSGEFVSLATEFTYGETIQEIEARLAAEEEARQAAARAAEEAAARAAAYASTSNSYTYNYAAPSGSDGAAVVNYACQFVGNPYVYGGSSLTNGTDCSGFVMSVYAAFGVDLPHSSYSLRSCGYEVSVSDMQPGDIICYSGHVALYVGNNTIVHAANYGQGITYTSPANYNYILTVRRIF